MEKSSNRTPAVCDLPVTEDESRLRRFIALHEDALLILGPRRNPPVPARAANTNTNIAIQTSLGFSTLESDEYVEVVQRLRPDIVLGMADYEYPKKSGVKRLEKMGDRTLAWLQDLMAGLEDGPKGPPKPALFAPILPIEAGQQSDYLNRIKDDLAHHVSGWVIFDPASVDVIPSEMRHLPRLALTNVRGPHETLDQIFLGIDAFVLPFIGEATDSGLALTFAFPGPGIKSGGVRQALGIDVWSTAYASDVSSIVQGCTCYACNNHHRAFIRHLLDAKEMLAWVLLQVHNHHTADQFFASVRQSIQKGTFEDDCDSFSQTYEREFPASTGKGPRQVTALQDPPWFDTDAIAG